LKLSEIGNGSKVGNQPKFWEIGSPNSDSPLDQPIFNDVVNCRFSSDKVDRTENNSSPDTINK